MPASVTSRSVSAPTARARTTRSTCSPTRSTFALGQKALAGDPAAVTAAETLAIATGERSPLLRGGGGMPLEAGSPADFLLIWTGAPELTPGDLVANLVYAASGSVVDTTVVAGRALMRGRSVEGAEEVVERTRERARALFGAG